jgi:hypothetical protein
VKKNEGLSKTFTMAEAQTHLGVSRTTLWRIMRDYNIETFTDVLDNRVKRVSAVDIDRVLRDAEHVRRGIAA